MPQVEACRLARARSDHGQVRAEVSRLSRKLVEAQRALRELVGEIEDGTVTQKSQWTFNDFADRFIEARRASGEYADVLISTDQRACARSAS